MATTLGAAAAGQFAQLSRDPTQNKIYKKIRHKRKIKLWWNEAYMYVEHYYIAPQFPLS